MIELPALTAKLTDRQDLDAAEVAAAARALAAPEVSEDAKAAFLSALSDKGESAGEVSGFARAFRDVAVNPGLEAHAPSAIDIVGTGGDHAGGFNISSMVVLTLASAGVGVMKHGNRGITSKCGSADLLGGLGFDIQAPPEKLRRAFDQLGYVFFFAPSFHPAFKHIAPVRKQLAAQGRRTIFNILGPLINPGRPAHVLLGVFAESWVERLAAALEALGTAGGLAAHGVISPGRGIDELTTATRNRVRGFGRQSAVDGWWEARDFGLPAGTIEELQGGDLASNLQVVEAILSGKAPAALVETIVLNAAVALWILGRAESPRAGIPVAREQLLGGGVRRKIDATKEFFRA